MQAFDANMSELVPLAQWIEGNTILAIETRSGFGH